MPNETRLSAPGVALLAVIAASNGPLYHDTLRREMRRRRLRSATLSALARRGYATCEFVAGLGTFWTLTASGAALLSSHTVEADRADA